ncbi:hypothetical protein SLS57_010923 [Botryosphaeria dothidea]
MKLNISVLAAGVLVGVSTASPLIFPKPNTFRTPNGKDFPTGHGPVITDHDDAHGNVPRDNLPGRITYVASSGNPNDPPTEGFDENGQWFPLPLSDPTVGAWPGVLPGAAPFNVDKAPNEVHDDIASDTPDKVLNEVHGEVPSEVHDKVPSDTPEKASSDSHQKVPTGIDDNIPSDVPRTVLYHGVPTEVKPYPHHFADLPADLREELFSWLPDNVKEKYKAHPQLRIYIAQPDDKKFGAVILPSHLTQEKTQKRAADSTATKDYIRGYQEELFTIREEQRNDWANDQANDRIIDWAVVI